MKYHTSTPISTKPKTPPTAPPTMAPILELATGEGVAVDGGFTGGVVTGDVVTGGGGGVVIICVLNVGVEVTTAVPELEPLIASLEFRLSVLMFDTAAVAWSLLLMVIVVSTWTTLALAKSRLYTMGIEVVV